MQFGLLVFTVLTVLGSWAAWRRSPLYSRTVSLKLAGALLLTVAAIAGVTLLIVAAPGRLSPEAQAILTAVAAVGLATCATGLIVRITDAHVAQLPPSTRIVTTQRHKVQRWMWRIAVYLLVCSVAALLLPQSRIWAPISLGGFVLLACGPALLALYMRARRLDLGLSSVIAAPWAYWRYTPTEWQSWALNQREFEQAQQAAMSWKQERRKLVKGVAMMAVIFVASAWLMGTGSAGERLAVAGGGMALVVLTAAIVNWANRNAPERRYRRLLASSAEVLFGDEGLFSNGEFSPWILSGSYLVEATSHHDPPPRLELVFQNFNGSSSVRVAKRIPIPEGRQSDVAILQQKLRGRCPKAAIRFT